MTKGLTTTTHVHFKQGRGTRKVMKEGEATEPPPQSAVPRIPRLMALAIHMHGLVDRGEAADCAELARLAHVSRARISQIMNLTLLAPDIQEALLFLPTTGRGRGTVGERVVRRMCAEPDWRNERRMWQELSWPSRLAIQYLAPALAKATRYIRALCAGRPFQSGSVFLTASSISCRRRPTHTASSFQDLIRSQTTDLRTPLPLLLQWWTLALSGEGKGRLNHRSGRRGELSGDPFS